MLMANATTRANVARLICAMRYRNTRKMDALNRPHSDKTRSHPPSNGWPQFQGPPASTQVRGEFVHALIAIIQRATRISHLTSVSSSRIYVWEKPSNFSSGTLALEYCF